MPGRPITPFLWLLFSAGGTVAALLLPVHLFLTGLAFPLGWVSAPSYETLRTLLGHPLTRLYLLVLISLPLFHWAHRFRFTLVDMGLRPYGTLLAFVFYGAAVVGTGIATLAVLSL